MNRSLQNERAKKPRSSSSFSSSMTNGPRIFNGENSIAGDRTPGEWPKWTAAPRRGGGSYHNNRIFPSGAALSTCLGLGEMVQSGGTQARHLGRSQTGLQGVGMLNMTILPEKPTNPERVLSVIDDRQHLKKKSAGRHWLLHRTTSCRHNHDARGDMGNKT